MSKRQNMSQIHLETRLGIMGQMKAELDSASRDCWARWSLITLTRFTKLVQVGTGTSFSIILHGSGIARSPNPNVEVYKNHYFGLNNLIL